MSAERPRVALLSAVRTPIGKYGGALRSVSAVQLGSVAATAAVQRSGLSATDLPMGYFGHGIQAGQGQNPARQVMRYSGVPDSSGAVTLNMVCGSGMAALIAGVAAIRAGDFPQVIVGGMESMSGAPYLVPARARWGFKAGPATLEDAVQVDALHDAYGEHEAMGLTGERIARQLGLTRADVDRFALRSHQRAAQARDSGTFHEELVPVPGPGRDAAPLLDRDQGPRGDSTLEGLGGLPSSFGDGGLLTAGNSSQLSDGAAAIVLASEEEVRRRSLKPLAWFHSSAVGGVAPDRVMEAPIPTVQAHLEREHLSAGEFDRIEHNEAFASASIAVQRAFQFADDRFNVLGGAVALGHPIGASGCRIVVTLLHELRRSGGKLGLATLCMGGGNGLSVILDRRDV